MNFRSHFTFGLFTGLLVYYFTQDVTAALVTFVVQIGLILDFIFKKVINFEPFHTLLMMFVVWWIAFKYYPLYHLYVILAYFTHLFLDMFVVEEIYLAWPYKKVLAYPIDKSENFVIFLSCFGIIIMTVMLIL